MAGRAACGRRTGLRSSPSFNRAAAADAGRRPCLRSSCSACRGGTATKSRLIKGGKGTNIHNRNQSWKPKARKPVKEEENLEYEIQSMEEEGCCDERKFLESDVQFCTSYLANRGDGGNLLIRRKMSKLCLAPSAPSTHLDKQLDDDDDDDDDTVVFNEAIQRRTEFEKSGQVGKSSDALSTACTDSGLKGENPWAIKWDVVLLSEPLTEHSQLDPPMMPLICSPHDENFTRYSPVTLDFQPARVYGCPRFPPYMIQSVEAALLRHKDKNGGPVLKLVKIIDFEMFEKRFCGFTLGEHVHHINFLVQSGDDPSDKMLFFAEGHYRSRAKSTYAIGLCCPLDSDKGIAAGASACGFCSGDPSGKIKHPVDGGFYGAVVSNVPSVICT